MQDIWKSKGKRIHTRTIEVTTYDYEGQKVIVEGVLKDDRFLESYRVTGEGFPSGLVHHMVIRLLVDCTKLTIEDVDVELIAVPREECREVIDSLAPIKGMTLAKGFSSKVKKAVGGKKGCAHLVELLQAMAPAVFQGYAAKQSQGPPHFDPEEAKRLLHFLVDSCHNWREDGPFIEMFKKKHNL